MRDFTVSAYYHLLGSLSDSGYSFQPFCEYLDVPCDKTTILRHDVDRLPYNSLRFAEMEAKLGVRASYYFRIVPQSFNPSIIKGISDLGHEIGYHYEDMDIARGDGQKAILSFQKNLDCLRKLVTIKTICMHGSPLSRYDNRELWKHYDYKNYGITGEPYFDLDYGKIFYITDTGRRWNNTIASIRDKVETHFDIDVKSTSHLIELIRGGQAPLQIMINTHPQRWNNRWDLWFREFISQNAKNVVKRYINSYRA